MYTCIGKKTTYRKMAEDAVNKAVELSTMNHKEVLVLYCKTTSASNAPCKSRHPEP